MENKFLWRHEFGIGARFTVCAYGAQLASLFDDYEFGTSSIGGVICGNYEDSSYWFALTDYSNPTVTHVDQQGKGRACAYNIISTDFSIPLQDLLMSSALSYIPGDDPSLHGHFSAAPAAGWLFRQWAENPAWTSLWFSLTNPPPVLTAVFEKAPDIVLTTEVISDPDGGCTPGYIVRRFAGGSPSNTVNLWAAALVGFQFVKWTGDGVTVASGPVQENGNSYISIYMDRSRSVTAVFRLTELRILDPATTPVTDNHFSFDTSEPGKCNVRVEGTGSCDLSWELEGIAGSILTSAPDPPQGHGVFFTYTNLPSENSEFGDKTLTLHSSVGSRTTTRIVQIFFSGNDWATNHPDADCSCDAYHNPTPDWYFYWKQTSANYGVHCYSDAKNTGVTWDTASHSWYVVLDAGSNDVLYLPLIGWFSVGIDTFAWSCRHEAAHMLDVPGWLPNGPDENIDSDGDFVPNDVEINVYHTDPNNMYSKWGSPYTDADFIAIEKQAPWTPGAAKAEDWSSSGQQSQE